MTVGTNTSVGGIGIGGKSGKLKTGAEGSTVSIGLVPSGSLRSLGGTTKGVYEGTSAVGKGIDIFCSGIGSGNNISGASTYTQGVPVP